MSVRLPPLPKAVRAAFEPFDFGDANPFAPTPENNTSAHTIGKHLIGGSSARAKVEIERVEIYRGRAQAHGPEMTSVYAIAVLDGRVLTSRKGYISWRRVEDRAARIAEAEHETAAELHRDVTAMVHTARAKVTARAHESLTSTKLMRINEEIAKVEAHLGALQARKVEIEAEV